MKLNYHRQLSASIQNPPAAYGNISKAPSGCTHEGWTDERVERLKSLWAEGLSASQCAKRLGGVTRCAVIGKVHRLGMPRRMRQPASTPGPRRAPLKVTNTGGARRVAAIVRLQAKEPPPMPRETIDTEFARPWVERGPGQCAFPVSGAGADTYSCCRPTKANYCAEHWRIMTAPTQPTLRKTMRIARIAA